MNSAPLLKGVYQMKKRKVRLKIHRGLPVKNGLGPWLLTRTYKRIKTLEDWEDLISELLYDVFEYRDFSPNIPCMVFYDDTPYLYKDGVMHKYVSVFYPEDHYKLLELLSLAHQGIFLEDKFLKESPICLDTHEFSYSRTRNDYFI